MCWWSSVLRARKIALLTLLTTMLGHSAQLKPEMLDAWNEYLHQENTEVLQRAQPNGTFLRSASDPAQFEQLRAGVILVAPMRGSNPAKAAGGLIHHWIGTAFIPNASAADVMAVTRDYTHYRQIYKPGVADARAVRLNKAQDAFTIRFVNASLLSKTVLEGQYVSDYIRVSDKRWYSVSITTQMQEIKDFGQANEKRLPCGQGSGYIWRLYSTSRLEERDGGVIIEVEAIALSRDVPKLLHVVADPIIRRVSRDSLNKSLEDTASAVRARNFMILRTSR